MTSSNQMALMAFLLLVLNPLTAVMADDLSPAIQSFNNHLCEHVNCGKGTCKGDFTYPFGFVCECDAGWKRTRDEDDELTFLPCVIPNCTLDYSCQPAPPPVPAKEFPFNSSYFDPCYWVYCGEGSCVRNETYTHTCQCNSGFYNLLNTSAFPCYSECTLGSDCAKLGIKVAKSTATSTSASGSGTGRASSILPGKLLLLAVLIMSLVVMWK